MKIRDILYTLSVLILGTGLSCAQLLINPYAIAATGGGGGGGNTRWVIEGTAEGSTSNSYAGYVGGRFTVGSSPIYVTSLDAWVESGSTQTHALKLFTAAGVELRSQSIDYSLHSGVWASSTLTSPITLLPGTDYIIGAQQFSGGDLWHEFAGTSYTFTGVATWGSAAYGTTYPVSEVGSSGQWYGPVSFSYNTDGNPPSSNLIMDLNPDTMFFSDGASANGVWQDSSSANNDMTLASGPTYETNELNGHAAVRFDATDDSGSSALNLSYPYTIYVVEKPAGTGSTRTVNSDTANALIANGRSGLQANLNGQVAGYVQDVSGVPNYCTLVVPATGTSSFFQNGVNTTVGSPPAVINWGTVTLGADGVFSEVADTDLYRVLIYSAAHDSTARAAVETYLTSQYGL